MEGYELQWNDTEDALQTVHCVRQFNGLICHFADLWVILATKDYGAALKDIDKI